MPQIHNKTSVMRHIRTSELLCPESLTLVDFTQFYLIQETTEAEFRQVIQTLARPSLLS